MSATKTAPLSPGRSSKSPCRMPTRATCRSGSGATATSRSPSGPAGIMTDNCQRGYPYGTLPRLLLFWLTTEAVRTGGTAAGTRGNARLFHARSGA